VLSDGHFYRVGGHQPQRAEARVIAEFTPDGPHHLLADAPPLEQILRLCAVMEQVIILRGLSWCFMAHHEYSHASRTLTNAQTREKISLYMRDLRRLIPALP